MDEQFRGFRPAVFEWFAGLERDNSRAYFAATRDLYEEEVRGGLEAMLDELAATFGGEARVFRQQRDLRFSPDKSPYKTRTYGVIHGRAQVVGGLYAELSAQGLYAGTGYYRLARDQLERFRAAVADDRTGPALEEAVATITAAQPRRTPAPHGVPPSAPDAGLELAGESLRTAPRGFPRDHPRIDLLRRKALFAGRRLPPGDEGIPREPALDHVAGSWRAAGPLTAWLDEHVGPSTLPPDPRGRRR